MAEIVVVIYVLLLGTLFMAPNASRTGLFFSVPVDPAFRTSPEGLAVLHGYRLRLLVGALVTITCAWAVWSRVRYPMRLGLILLLMLAQAPPFFWARRRVLPHLVAPSTVREASLSPRRGRSEGAILEMLPFLGLLGTAVYLALHWSELPARFPRHFDMVGHPVGWAGRSFFGVYGTLWVIGVLVAIIAARIGIWHSRRVQVSGPSGKAENTVRRRVSGVFLLLEYLVSWLTGRLALLPVWPGSPAAILAGSIGATLAVVLALLWFAYRTPRSGTDGTDNSRWIAGLFYVNRDDPAVWVEKRFGFGWTLNFGRPMAWLLPIFVLAFAALAVKALAH
jgi:uncharacterized membrane protein